MMETGAGAKAERASPSAEEAPFLGRDLIWAARDIGPNQMYVVDVYVYVYVYMRIQYSYIYIYMGVVLKPMQGF